MESKKINQLATNVAPVASDLTIVGDPITGVSKKITLSQIASLFAGSLDFYTNLAGFPVTGLLNTIYCAKDTQKLYLWSGSAYVETFPSQAVLNTYQLLSAKGVANGYASLDASGKVPIGELPSSIMEYKGLWSAATNTPTLANGTGDTGDVYIASTAGSVNFGAGAITFAIGDYVIYSGSIWQRSSGAVGTVTSVAITESGDSLNITGSPITTSGTINIGFNGTNLQYVNGAGNLTTFPILTGFVPYTGATQNVDLGVFDLTADLITGATGSFASSGGSDTFAINHSSGAGIALNITKGGNGEGLYINKTSGSGNAATIIGTLEATTLVKNGGTSSQFLKADGTVDSNTYALDSLVVHLAGNETITGVKNFNLGLTLQDGYYPTPATGYVGLGSNGSGITILTKSGITVYNNNLQFSNASNSYYFPNATGTIALTSDLTGGTVTSVAALTIGTTGTDLSSTVANSTTTPVITLNVPTASATNRGALSSADWTTFNNKQNALTNPVTGTGTINTLPKFTAASTIGNSNITDTGSLITLGSNSYVNGNLGIGITPSAWGSGQRAIQTPAGAIWNFNSSNMSIVQNVFSDGTEKYVNNGFASTYNQNSGQHVWRTAPSGTAGAAISFTQAMTLTASGRLLINTPTEASYLLDVNGTGRFSDRLNVFKAVGENIIIANYDVNNRLEISAAGLNLVGGNNFYIRQSSGANQFTLNASTGAATFSSSVTATSFEVGNGQYYTARRSSGNLLINLLGIESGTDNTRIVSTNDFNIVNGSLVSQFKIAASGAATFSSSVTATNGLFSGGGEVIRMYGSNPYIAWWDSANTTRYGYIQASSGLLNIVTNTGVDINFGAGGADRMRIIASTGNVGIGSTAPDQKLTIQAAGTANGLISFKNLAGTTTNLIGQPNAAGDVISTSGTDDLCFRTQNGNMLFALSNIEFARFTPGGSLLIGTTTDAGGKLQVNGEIRMTGSTLFRGMSSNTLQLCGGTSSSNVKIDGSVEVITMDTNGATRLTIASTGAATFSSSVTATSFFESSDSRLKTLIQDNYQTKGIGAITPKLYTKNGKVELGYYAQDFVGILDSAVSKGSDDMLSLSYREVLVAKVYALEQRIKELETK